MANKIIEEMIAKAKAASVANRGAYPVTAATNVFKKDGSRLEEKSGDSKLPDEPVAEPEVVIELSDPETTVSGVIATIEEDAVIGLTEGEVAETLTVDKGVTIQGVNAGVAQNYLQEVE